MAIPTQARVLEYYNYDPASGHLIFKERPESEFSAPRYSDHLKRVGEVAGHVDFQGYCKVCVDGANYPAHKIIWLMMYGEWVQYPKHEIDHINGERSDNRLSNLRKVTKSENQRNTTMRVCNTSGVHGVNWKPTYNKSGGGRWVARIWNGPRHVYLGSFKEKRDAAIARQAAERALGYTVRAKQGRNLREVR